MAASAVPRRALAVALGLFLGLALVEGTLQLGALLKRDSRAPVGRKVVNDDAPHVLFLGDSQTFGLWVRPDQTMPARAEELARELCPPGMHAYNYGRAASASWNTIDEARAAVPVLRPDAVVYRSGMANTLVVRPENASFLSRLRLVRLLTIAWRGRQSYPDNIWFLGRRWDELPKETAEAVTPQQTIGDYVVKHDEPFRFSEREREELEADVRAVHEIVRAAGSRLFLVGYSAPDAGFCMVSIALQDIAKDLGVPYIDTVLATREAMRSAPPQEFHHRDGHPKKLGYAIEARQVVSHLAKAGVLRGEVPGTPSEWAVAEKARLAAAADARSVAIKLLWKDATGIRIAVTGLPMTAGNVVLGPPGESWVLGEVEIPIDSASATLAAAAPETHFVTDSKGNAEVLLPNELLAKFRKPVWCAAVIPNRSGAPEDLSLSAILDLETGAEARRGPASGDSCETPAPRVR